MKALALVPGTTRLGLVERPEPRLDGPTDVTVQVLEVGICGTDRDQVRGGRSLAPAGRNELVIGHEMLGRVREVGREGTRFAPGDLCVAVVRRPCAQCTPCAMRRQDMCVTGEYLERGIWGLDGFDVETIVEPEEYLVPVPGAIASTGVLVEPLSVAEKALDLVLRLQQSRLPDATVTPAWFHDRSCLVAGLGPVGLLTALALRLAGAVVYGLDVVDRGSARARWLEAIGGRYVDGREVPASAVEDVIRPMEVIVEAAGAARLQFNLLEALAPSGAYVLTGIPEGESCIELPAAELLRRLVLNNQVMAGSVNAARDHYVSAVDDLVRARERWGTHVDTLITARVPFERAADVFAARSPGEIKTVLCWGTG